MKFIDFPKNHHLSKNYGVYALPNGCWAVNTRVQVETSLTSQTRSVLIWPDGEIIWLPGRFIRTEDCDYVGFFGKLNEDEERTLSHRGLSFTNRNNTIKFLKIEGKDTRNGQCRKRYLDPKRYFDNGEKTEYYTRGWEPGLKYDPKVIVAPISKTYPLGPGDLMDDLSCVIQGILGQNLGVGFYRVGAGGRFINPDPSKEWHLACLSIDELTCLAAHDTGVCILDVPV